MKATPTTNNGKPAWRVSIPASIIGKRVRIFGPTKDAAMRSANEYLAERQLHGGELASLTTQERAFLLRVRERGISLESAEQSLKAAARPDVPLSAAIDDYLASQKGNSKGHIGSLKSAFKAFLSCFAGRTLSAVRPADIAKYLRAHKAGERAIYRRLRAFYNWAVMMELAAENPLAKIPKPGRDTSERIIFTSAEMQALLDGAKDDPVMLRALVFGGFMGLRTAEILHLRCEDVDADGETHVRRMKTQKKGIRERWVRPEPNARAWIAALALPPSGPLITVNEKNFREHRNRLLEHIPSVPAWPYNALRRSFGSYHLAAFENAARTAFLMGHTDPETTVSKYQAVRKKSIGEEWFAIEPPAPCATAQTACASPPPAPATP